MDDHDADPQSQYREGQDVKMTGNDHQNEAGAGENDENYIANEQQRTEEEMIREKSMRYEYYVHYLGLDRRTERWVTEHFIRVDDQEEIQKQDQKVRDIE